MKSLRYLPIAYMAGVHGFVFFAPYLALVLTAVHVIRRARAERPLAPSRALQGRIHPAV